MRLIALCIVLVLAGCAQPVPSGEPASSAATVEVSRYFVDAGDDRGYAFVITAPEKLNISFEPVGADNQTVRHPDEILVLGFLLEDQARLLWNHARHDVVPVGRDTEGHADHGFRARPMWGTTSFGLEDQVGATVGFVVGVRSEVPVRVEFSIPARPVGEPVAADTQYFFQQTGGVNDLLVVTEGITVTDLSSGPLHDGGHVRKQTLRYAWPQSGWAVASISFDHWFHAGSWSAQGNLAGRDLDEHHDLPPMTGRPDSPLTPYGPFQWGVAGLYAVQEGSGTDLTFHREIQGANDQGEYWTMRTIQLAKGPGALFGLPAEAVFEIHVPQPPA